MTNPIKVADSLSEAMRAALLGAHRVSSFSEARNIYFRTPERTSRALQRRGLIRGWSLTLLGKQVRAILQEREQ